MASRPTTSKVCFEKPEGFTMGNVIASATMSLDGFIARPDDTPGPLFDWYDAGPVDVPTAVDGFVFHLTPESAEYWQAWTAQLGALVVGRTLFDITDGWQGNHPIGVPVVVVTHEPPAGWNPPGSENFHFVTEGVEAAVAKAQEIASGLHVGVAAGQIASQCLAADLLDQVMIDLAPVVLGEGKPYFDSRMTKEVVLGNPFSVVVADRVTHMAFSLRD
jgi:dihydrofolate reductase